MSEAPKRIINPPCPDIAPQVPGWVRFGRIQHPDITVDEVLSQMSPILDWDQRSGALTKGGFSDRDINDYFYNRIRGSKYLPKTILFEAEGEF